MRGLLILGVAVSSFALGCDQLLGSSTETKVLEGRVGVLEQKLASVGRYQVVNPTPDAMRNAMLLDTVTGHSWVACTITGDDGKPIAGTENHGWCEMTQANGRGYP
jgi:hypothetical protein